MAPTTDPLAQLPAELVLRIVDNLSQRSVARLTRCSKGWYQFIDQVHQEHIYANKAARPLGSRDSFLSEQESYLQYMKDVKSWKDVCKRQTLLRNNWASDSPVVQESLIQVGRTPVWRFRPDFKNRYIVSTSQTGGLSVTDMDTGHLLWGLPEDHVRAFAHLEYSEGYAAWDCENNAIEIWKPSDTGRGHMEQVTILPHDIETRGFHLVYPTLCVVSTQGKAFTYDLSGTRPTLEVQYGILDDAVGHLVQNETVVAHSFGANGYYFYNKTTGAPLGGLSHRLATRIMHVNGPPKEDMPEDVNVNVIKTSIQPLPMGPPSATRLERLHIRRGRRHVSSRQARLSPRLPHDEDEWGAGLLQGKIFVGISRGGRALICTNYEEALRSPTRVPELTTIIECENNPLRFDFGGWLAVKHGRVLFEVGDYIYILTLPDEERPSFNDPHLPIWALPLSSSKRLNIPCSWMGMFNDCLMTTYGMIARQGEPVQVEAEGATHILPFRPYATKAIRIVSFAPDIEHLEQWRAAGQVI